MANKKLYIPVFAILVTGLIIGSFYDIQISTALYLPGNGFGVFLAAVGELPGYGALAFCGGYVLITAWRHFENKLPKTVLMIAGIISLGCACFFLGKAITSVNGYNMPDKKWIIGIPIASAILIPLFILGIVAGKKVKNTGLWNVALAILLSMAVAIGVITVVKLIPHRPRFRTVMNAAAGVEFHDWWQPCSNYKDFITDTITKEEFKSFPSGHVGISAGFVFMVYLPTLLEKRDNKTIRMILFYSAFAYILLLAYTRIMVGAHYLSDVSMGGLIAMAIHFTVTIFIDKYLPKQTEEKEKELEA